MKLIKLNPEHHCLEINSKNPRQHNMDIEMGMQWAFNDNGEMK